MEAGPRRQFGTLTADRGVTNEGLSRAQFVQDVEPLAHEGWRVNAALQFLESRVDPTLERVEVAFRRDSEQTENLGKLAGGQHVSEGQRRVADQGRHRLLTGEVERAWRHRRQVSSNWRLLARPFPLTYGPTGPTRFADEPDAQIQALERVDNP